MQEQTLGRHSSASQAGSGACAGPRKRVWGPPEVGAEPKRAGCEWH